MASSDLSSMDGDAPPTLQHVWEDDDLSPHTEEETIELKRGGFRGTVLRSWKRWWPRSLDLLNLGGGRFCVAKAISVEHSVMFDDLEEGPRPGEDFVVLSGVEVLRGGGDGEGCLRMVKHKSKRYTFGSHRIEWVL
ncbi:hypothetical protein BAE44_0002164 [Dichanthelium oligosanthes]|uniref:Uncharacterized protein n=1 Tax=Dichanthelium oligosanthes TaxID=888268 RepID=A0A1E5WHH9_9POAL|nr:hypothetical protein BAE44_0002164 [Dichanthelium oligosanthes]